MSEYVFGVPPKGDFFPMAEGMVRTFTFDLVAGQREIVVPGQSNAGYNIVLVNGVVLNSPADYTENSVGQVITLKFDVPAGSSAKVIAFNPFEVKDVATRAELNTAVDLVRYASTYMFQVTWWPGARANIPAGWAPGDGQLLTRSLYPDVVAELVKGTMPVVTDAAWLADATKRASFTMGDGSTTFRMPDYNGKQPGSLGSIFQRGDGANSTGVAGQIQGDAIRNITGTMASRPTDYPEGAIGATTGALNRVPSSGTSTTPLSITGGAAKNLDVTTFDASRVVPTANENRPLNATGCWIVKLFGVVTNAGAADAGALATAYAQLASKQQNLESRAGDSGAVSWRNRIINGALDVWQRGSSIPVSNIPTAAYLADRFGINGAGTSGAVTVTQQADAPSGYGFANSLRVTVTTADASIAAGDLAYLNTRLEGYTIRSLQGRTFTLSFWVKSSKTGTHCVNIGNNIDRVYVVEYTISAANTWEFKTITVPGGLPASGTWNFANGLGLMIGWALCAGTTFQAAGSTWGSAYAYATTSQVNVLDTVGATFAITGIQLEEGSIATPFEHRPIGTELALCQRYYWRGGRGWAGTANATTNILLSGTFPVPMRVSPTINGIANMGTSAVARGGGANENIGSYVSMSAGVGGGFLYVGGVGYTLNAPYTLVTDLIEASAEL